MTALIVAIITPTAAAVILAGLATWLTRAHLLRGSVGPETPATEAKRKGSGDRTTEAGK